MGEDLKSLPRLLKQSAWIMLGVLLLAGLFIPRNGGTTAAGTGGPASLASDKETSSRPAAPPGTGDQPVDGIGEPVSAAGGEPLSAAGGELKNERNFDPNLDRPGLASSEPAVRPPIVQYVVQPGDTLSGIAETFNTDVTSLVAANNLTRRDFLQIGVTLKVPTAQGVIYTVARGDTLWDIAQQYGVSQDDIVSFNRIDASNPIQPGQEIVLPGAKPATVAVAGVAVASRGGSDRSSGSPAAEPTGGLYIWPVHGPITSGFGPRWGSFHSGLDIAVPSGTPIAAARAGTVIQAGWRGDYGYAVEIGHGNGVSTLYGHMSQILVNVGQNVNRGDTIGRSGSTGNSTGPHVHFEIRVNGTRVNPEQYLP